LGRLAGRDDVVFGTTVAGRPSNLPGVESMVGLFINTLPVRVQTTAERRLAAWFHDLHDRGVASRRYEHTPLAQIARWSEMAQGRPLFETLLVFENYPVEDAAETSSEASGGGLRVTDVRVEATTNYPFALRVTPGPRILVEALWDPARYDPDTATEALDLMVAALEAVVAGSDRRVAEVSEDLEGVRAGRLEAARSRAGETAARRLRSIRKRRGAGDETTMEAE
jgi:non-ribosomal peptide synthetase component F